MRLPPLFRLIMICCWVQTTHSETLTEKFDHEEYCPSGSEECTATSYRSTNQSAGKPVTTDTIRFYRWGADFEDFGWWNQKTVLGYYASRPFHKMLALF